MAIPRRTLQYLPQCSISLSDRSRSVIMILSLRSQHTQAAQALTTPRQRYGAFLLASATALLTAAPSFYEALWPLAWVALVPLFVALREASPKRALLLGWWAETLMYWVGLLAHWHYGTLWLHYGAFECVLLCHHRPGQWHTAGAFCVVAATDRRSTYPWWVRLLLPQRAPHYVAFDYLYPRVFPWYLGFLQLLGLPFIQIADIAGVHGVTFVLVLCNTVVATFIRILGSQSAQGVASWAWGVPASSCSRAGMASGVCSSSPAAMQRASPLRVALYSSPTAACTRSGAVLIARRSLTCSLV